MSYISELKRFYPRTYKARYAINAYNTHKYFEHEDPTVITIHETTLNYGGPEEGNWYYTAGYPIKSHCIFNKKQAIKTYILELKNRQTLSLPEFWREAQVEALNYAKARGLGEAPLSYVVVKRRNASIDQAWVIQDLNQWLKEKK